MKYAKKILVTSTTNRLDPVTNKLNDLEEELNKILANKDIPNDEKVKLYQQSLNKYLEYYQQKASTKKSNQRELNLVQDDIKKTQQDLKQSQNDLQELYKKNTAHQEEFKKSFQYTPSSYDEYYDAMYDDDDYDYDDSYPYDNNNYYGSIASGVREHYDDRTKRKFNIEKQVNSNSTINKTNYNSKKNPPKTAKGDKNESNIPKTNSLFSFMSKKQVGKNPFNIKRWKKF